jgi:hypothetical protein
VFSHFRVFVFRFFHVPALPTLPTLPTLPAALPALPAALPALPAALPAPAARQLRSSAPPVTGGTGAVGTNWRDQRGALPPTAGDLVLLVGLGDDAVHVAREVSAGRGWPVSWVRSTTARSGTRAGARAATRAGVIADRRAALAARAEALRLDRAVLLAHTADLDDPFTIPVALRPDRVWAVVDASRTFEDTVEWVHRLDTALGVDGVAIIGTAFTRDRGTAARLGLPLAWHEPEPSA